MVSLLLGRQKNSRAFLLWIELRCGTLPPCHFPFHRMMSLETIIALNNQIADEAIRNDLAPFVPDGPEATDDWPPFPFPNLGHVPDGWQVAEQFFVDKTGLGRSSEPALTVDQFRSSVHDHIMDHPEHGYAIIEEGPFQVIVAALQRTRRDLADRLSQ